MEIPKKKADTITNEFCMHLTRKGIRKLLM